MTTPSGVPTGTGWTTSTKISLFALLVSGIALFFSIRSSNIAQRTDDRTSGKLKAQFVLDRVGNTDEKATDPLYKKTQLGKEAIYLDNVNRLVQWNPSVEVTNNGEENIHSFRVEVKFVQGFVVDIPPTSQKPTPYVFVPSSLELEVPGKLEPGFSASFSIIRPLLAQMLQAQVPEKLEREHWGSFSVKVYGRIVGGTTFDRPEPYKEAQLHFVWLPSAFSTKNSNSILESDTDVKVVHK